MGKKELKYNPEGYLLFLGFVKYRKFKIPLGGTGIKHTIDRVLG